MNVDNKTNELLSFQGERQTKEEGRATSTSNNFALCRKEIAIPLLHAVSVARCHTILCGRKRTTTLLTLDIVMFIEVAKLQFRCFTISTKFRWVLARSLASSNRWLLPD
jgi:hypothetical protein